jgi:hypothetical protein
MLGLLGDQTCICPMDRHMEDRHTNETVSPSFALPEHYSCTLRLCRCIQHGQPEGPLIILPSRPPANRLSSRPPYPFGCILLPAIWFIHIRCAFRLFHVVFQVSISPPDNLFLLLLPVTEDEPCLLGSLDHDPSSGMGATAVGRPERDHEGQLITKFRDV